MAEFNVNNRDVVKWTNELEKIHKSAMPVTVRGTLNDLAFFAKKKELMKTFDKQFIVRSKSFIRSHTAVNKSPNTFDLKKMHSELGVIKNKDAADGLQAQELGGKAEKSKHIAFRNKNKIPARIAGKHEKKITKRRRLDQMRDAVKVNSPKRNPFQSQKFIKTAIKGGKGTYINYNNRLIGRVKKVKTRPLFIDFERLYFIEDDRNYRLPKSPFLMPAAQNAYKHVLKFFKRRAKRKLKPKI